MTIRVIGAGVGRTGTTSLQAALVTLLDGPCYHMHEIFPRPDDIPVWHQAARGEMPDWRQFLRDFNGAVDWPASAFWEEIAGDFPEAVIVLTTRDPEDWWRSASGTIFPATLNTEDSPWRRMIFDLFKNRFTDQIESRETAIAAYERHNAYVRATAPAERLLEWHARDGWEPLCRALDLPVPDEPFPHLNTSEDFASRVADSQKNKI